MMTNRKNGKKENWKIFHREIRIFFNYFRRQDDSNLFPWKMNLFFVFIITA